MPSKLKAVMIFNTIVSATVLLVELSSHVEAGSLDGPPQQNPDGSCSSYVVKSGDNCDKIRIEHNIASLENLDTWNANTWAWKGCAGLQG